MEPSTPTPDTQESAQNSQTQKGISSIRVRSQPRVARNQFDPGTILKSRYRIGNVIGVGGFGVVYEGFDKQEDDKLLAIKTLKHNIADYEQAAERFTREIDLCSRITSRHAVKIHDCGIADDETLFYVMEFLEGFSLESFIADREKLTFLDLKYVYLQILDALGEAHSKNIIHRDLKPANIWMQNTDDESQKYFVKLLDFGIAKSLDPEEQAGKKLTQTGAWTGSPAYMSPEHLTGKPLAPTTDIFSLGLIAIEALTGYQAVEGDSPMDIAMTIVSPTSEIFVDEWILNTSIGQIISKCVQKDPTLRYKDGNELAEAFKALDDNDLKNEFTSAKMRRLTTSGRRSTISQSVTGTNGTTTTQLGESEEVIKMRRERQIRAVIIIGIVFLLIIIGIVIFVSIYVNKAMDERQPNSEQRNAFQNAIQEQINQGVKNQGTIRMSQHILIRGTVVGMGWGIACDSTCVAEHAKEAKKPIAPPNPKEVQGSPKDDGNKADDVPPEPLPTPSQATDNPPQNDPHHVEANSADTKTNTDAKKTGDGNKHGHGNNKKTEKHKKPETKKTGWDVGDLM